MMRKQGTSYKWVSMILAMATFDVYAQNQVMQELAPVVVTASSTQQHTSETIPHTTVISSDDIKRTSSTNLRDVLQREAGVQLTQSGGPGTATSIYIRGADTRQSLILLDGVPMNKQDASGAVSIEQIPLEQIDRIEVVRGNVSAIYGSAAMGGVVQIFTKTGKGPAQFTASAEIGSRRTARVAAGVSGSTGDLSYALNVSKYKTEGFSAQNPAQNKGANPDNDGFNNQAISGQLGYSLTADNQIGVRFMHTDGTTDFDNSFSGPKSIQQNIVHTDMYSVYSNNKLTQNWQSNLTYSKFKDRSKSVDGKQQDWFATDTDQVQWNNAYRLSHTWQLTGGVEYRREGVSTTPSFGSGIDTSRRVFGAFLGTVGRIGDHSFQVNGRHDSYSDVGSANTYYLGYGYNLTDRLRATAAYSTAFAAAPLGYLFAPFYGNPNLKPEDTHTKEVGLQYDHETLGLAKMTFFKSNTTNQITYDFATSRFQNLAEVDNKGVELSYIGRVLDTDVRMAYTNQDPIDRTTGKTVVRRAKDFASLTLTKNIGLFTLGGEVFYTGRRPDVGTKELGAYTLFNALVSYRVYKDTNIYVRGENLTGKTYQTAFGYNQAPRSVYIGVNSKF